MDRRAGLVAACIVLLVIGCGLAGNGVSAPYPNLRLVAEAASTPAARKIALIVGINYYPNLPGGSQLSGPVNDAVLLAQTIESSKYGFRAQDVHLLLSPQRGQCPPAPGGTQTACLEGAVTKQAIVDAFRQYLIRGASSGDILVFAYAGHGSLWDDLQEPSRRARTLVPTDSRDSNGSGTDLLTVELANLVTEALARQPLNLTIILDSCNSGSRIRGAAVSRGIGPDTRPGVQARYRGLLPAPPSRGGSCQADPADQSFFTINRPYVLLAAAREDQSAYEAPDANNVVHGTFTRALVDALQRATSQTTYRELLEPVAARILGERDGAQMPVLEGARDAALFGGQVRDQPSYLVIGAAPTGSVGTVELPAGRAAGVTVGSVYDVYPATDFAFSDPTKKLGEVRVEQVSIDSAVARVTSKTAPPGAHAVERIHAQAAVLRFKMLATGLPATFASAVTASLKRSAYAFQFSDAPAYDVAVVSVKERPGYVQAVLATGEAIGGAFRVADPQTAEIIAKNIIKYANVRMVADLGNAASQLHFLATWKAYPYDNSPVPQRNGYPVLRALSEQKGDEIAFTVAGGPETGPDCPLYAAIVDIGVDGTIGVAPEHRADGVLISAGPWTVRYREVVPKGMPQFTRGKDIFKVFVATRPLNLGSLEQAGYRYLPREVTPASGTRGEHETCADDWAVRDFVFWVDRVTK